MNGCLMRNGVGRQVGDDEAERFVGDKQPHSRAGEREQKRFGEQLADEA